MWDHHCTDRLYGVPTLTCRPPWHFWSWFGMAEAQRMLEYESRYGLRLRMDTHVPPCRDFKVDESLGMLGRGCSCGPSRQWVAVWRAVEASAEVLYRRN